MDVREKLVELPIEDALLVLREEHRQRTDSYATYLAHGGKGDPAEEVGLDALAIAISALEKTKWISVKDRLPEMGEHYQSEDVLVCIDYRPDDPGTTEDTDVSIDHVDFNCFGQGEFSCERDDPRDGEPSPYFVTHWMPLPLAPEED